MRKIITYNTYMNKNRLKALLYKQESKQVILSSSIDSSDPIKQNNSS